MSNKFYKPIFLPSNGLTYSSILNVTPITMDYVFAIGEQFFNGSSTELLYSFIKKYSDELINIEDLYWVDAYYIWLYLLMVAFDMTSIETGQVCSNCDNIDKVKVNLSDLDLIINKNKQKFLSYHIKKEGYRPTTIKYDRRRIRHNIQSGNKILSDVTIKEDKKKLIRTLIEPQLEYILVDGAKLKNKKAWEDLFNSLTNKEIFNIFDKLQETDFGFASNIFYNCKSCKHQNKTNLYSPYVNSIYSNNRTEEDEKINKRNIENVVNVAISLSKAKITTYSEVLNMTPKELAIVTDRASELLGTGNGSLSLSPEDFMEQFGVA